MPPIADFAHRDWRVVFKVAALLPPEAWHGSIAGHVKRAKLPAKRSKKDVFT
jgi:hypothetical protein